MAKLPVVAIIGRPNTGKSTLFNRLVGHRKAIVHDTAGTTRDPVAARVDGEKIAYLLMDTGGMGGGTEDRDFEDDVHAQSMLALEHADLILFIVNSKEELTAADHAVVSALRRKRRQHVPVFLVITKCDDPEKMDEALPRFYELGIADEMFPISAPHALGIDSLEAGIEDALTGMHFGTQEDEEMRGGEDEEARGIPRIALVGRPNVGKSSLINALMPEAQKEKQSRITSDVPGTTRDTTDTIVRSHGKEFLFLDTAGLRKNKKKQSEIESFAALRTLQAIEDADVTVLVLDPQEEIGRQDKRIAGVAIERGTGLVLVVNKIDLLSPDEQENYLNHVDDAFAFCQWAPVLCTSAKSKEHLTKLFEILETVCENRKRRISTSVINRWFADIVAKYQPKGIGGKSVKTKYVTQVSATPPTFALFLNDPKRLHFSSLRFMEKSLRKQFGFTGTPMRWVKKGKGEE